MSKEGDALNSDWGLPAGENNDQTEENVAAQDSENDKENTEAGNWGQIRAQYDDPKTTQREARHQAVRQLRKENHFAVVNDSGTLYRYDPDAGFYRDDGEQLVRVRLEKQLGKYNSKSEAGNIVYRLQHRNRVDADAFGPPGLVCLNNGVLDVSQPSTPELEEHDPNHLFARQWPVAYDPSADCPRFKQFLDESVPADDLKKLQEFVGYAVIHHWGIPYKKALLLLGPTDSGKSTFLNVVEALLGEENVANESFSDLANGDFASAQLHGKLANIYADLDSKLVKNIGLFKSLTGNDRLSAQKKYQSKFKFRPTQKLLFAANSVPNVENEDDAFYNRWLYVRFPEQVPADEQDNQLEQKLIEELPGILNWALEGYQRLRKEDAFTNERSIDEKRSFWQSYGDSVERFVENGPAELRSGAETPKDQIYEMYQLWGEEQGHPVKHKTTLSKKLKRKYDIESCYLTVDGERVYCYRGITPANDKETDANDGWGVEDLD